MPDIYEYDPATFYRLKPELVLSHRTDDFDVTIRTDSHGWRSDHEISRTKPPGVSRVLFLGDSITFGWGVEEAESFPSLAAAKLTHAGVRGVEVINLAVPSFSSCASTARFKLEGLKLKPDVACAVIVLANDFGENGRHHLYRRSPFFSRFGPQVLKTGLWARQLMISAVSGFNKTVPESLELNFLPYNGALLATGLFHALSLKVPERSVMRKIENQLSLACADDFYRSATAAGIEPFLIIADTEIRQPEQEAGPSDTISDREALIVRHFRERGMHYANLSDELRRRYPAMGGLPNFRNDSHLTKEGHRLLAEALIGSSAWARMAAHLRTVSGAAAPPAR